MKKPILIAAGVLVVILLVLRALGPGAATSPFGDVRNTSQSGRTIVAFGDALVDEGGIPAPLTTLLGHEVAAMGAEGQSSPAALVRIDQVIARQPNFVIVSLGADDLRARIPLDETMNALETIFTRLVASGALVAYVPVDVPGIGDNWSMAIKDLAESKGVLVVDGATRGIWSTPDTLDETTRLDEPGRQAVAERVHAKLRPFL